MRIILLFLAVTLICLYLYLFVKKKVSGKKYIILNMLRVINISVLVWLIANPSVTFVENSIKNKKAYFLIDNSRSMMIEDEGNPAQPRISAVNKLFFTGENNISDMLKKKGIDFEVCSIGSGVKRGVISPLSANETFSGIFGGLKNFLADMPSSATDGIFLISDGQCDENIDTGSINYKTKITTIGVGNPNKTPDLSILRVDGPQLASVGQLVEITVVPSAQLIPDGSKIIMDMVDSNGNVLSSKEAVSPIAQNYIFKYTPEKEGMEILNFSIKAESGIERYLINNSMPIGILARKDFLNIMLIGVPSWDMAFLIRQINNIKNAKLFVYNIIGENPPSVFSVADLSVVKDLAELSDKLASQDALILCDAPAKIFSGSFIESIERFVSKKGGGLFVIGGQRSLGSGGYVSSPLKDMVPVDIVENDFLASRSKTVLADNARSRYILADFLNSVDVSKLSPIDGLNISPREKPVSETLLFAKTELEEIHPLFTVSRHGAGKSALLAGKGFFRWNMESDNESGVSNPLGLFYKNVIRWVSSPETQPFLRVNIPKNNFYIGEQVPIEAVTLDKNYYPAKSSKVYGTVTDANGRVEKLVFSPVSGDVSAFSCIFTPDNAGKYHIEINQTGGNAMPAFKTDIAVHLPANEFKQVNSDWEYLKSIAKLSGGEFHTLADFKTALERIKPEHITEKISITKPVTDYPYILIIIIFLITAEWYIKVKEGLN